MAAALFAVCAVLAWAAAALPGPARGPAALIGLAGTAAAALTFRLPWRRWPTRATLVLTVPAFAIIAGANASGLTPPRTQSAMFILTFVWVGAAHPRWSSLPVAPLAAAAYTISTLRHANGLPLDPRAVVLVTAVCVAVAETIATSGQRLARANTELQRVNADLRFLAEHTTDLVARVGADGCISYVSPSVHAVLGWRPEQLLGEVAHRFCHREDTAAIRAPLAHPDQEPVTVLGRLRRADGGYTWCEAITRVVTGPGGHREMLISARDISQRLAAEAELAHRATHDPLTGLPNRAGLATALSAALGDPHRGPLTVAFIDLDGFKGVNDIHGHPTGDRLLAQVARRLQRACREQDTVARYGGDEFVLVIDTMAPAQLPTFIQRLEDELAKPYRLGPLTLHLGASIGAVPAGPDMTPEDLITAADHAMYATKRTRRALPAVPAGRTSPPAASLPSTTPTSTTTPEDDTWPQRTVSQL